MNTNDLREFNARNTGLTTRNTGLTTRNTGRYPQADKPIARGSGHMRA
jgi:hypothetical protein